MIALAVDTSTFFASVAVLQDHAVRAQLVQSVRSTHSDRLMVAIEQTLAAAELDKKDLDLLLVCRGPGSFSGLRIGIAAMSGLAAALHLPLHSFVNLDLLALQFSICRGFVCPVVDARRGQLYWSLYAVDEIGERRRVRAYGVDNPERIIQLVDVEKTLIVGPGADVYRAAMESAAGVRLNCIGLPLGIVNLALVSRLVAEALTESPVCKPGQASPVTPLYIRPSDAEINLGRKTSGLPDPGHLT
ncbi:MAG: tRNA (adenosine(37)-N6)-threonylcarbamoyltransferase complex dimerization subunit type 1 TsaB [Deltaproteobacteria bacterium]|nr:tRNA (adenosine(37)-N6)-threonylcarbamoyltransferase complex dimerization subunit type 1 TsaB [Candidatus Anaeroferrophillus wilburensis]MBN2889328.1 tRNA (adenosine(37)-N6)-threonylcarbamoyltransferase complex dimerization subunit type 1 TsaB [Deltaproteobacteria bacterium]